MHHNISAKRFYCRICSENAFHLTKHFFTFFNCCRIRLMFQHIICGINQCQCILIQFQMNHTTFIIYRSCCPIFNRLRHIIDINIITKYFPGIPIFGRNRCPCESDKSSIWQCIMYYSGISHYCPRFFFASFIL